MSEKLRNKIGENEELRQKKGSDCSTYNENAGNLAKDGERKGEGECTDAELLNLEILKEFQNMKPLTRKRIICLVRSLPLVEQEETFSVLQLSLQRNP